MAAMEDGKPSEQTQFPRVGRPRKPLHEKRRKQQEATKWRDARRVYLGNSYDRWKKLKSRIGLKDCSLAWHLMEAHDSHCVECGRGTSLGDDDDGTPHNFFPQIIKSIRRICMQYLSFQHTVEVVGLVCLEIDKGTKENFSIKEVVNRPIGLRVEALASQQKSSENDYSIELANDEDEDDDDDDEICDEDDDDEMSDASNMGSDDGSEHKPLDHYRSGVGDYSKGDDAAFSRPSENDVTNDSDSICDKSSSRDVPSKDGIPESRGGNSSLNFLSLTSMQERAWTLSPSMLSASAKMDISRFVNDNDSERSSNSVSVSPFTVAEVKAEEEDRLEEEESAAETIHDTDDKAERVTPTVFSIAVAETLPSEADHQTSPIDLVVKQEPADHPQPNPPNLVHPCLDNRSPATTPDNSGKKRKIAEDRFPQILSSSALAKTLTSQTDHQTSPIDLVVKQEPADHPQPNPPDHVHPRLDNRSPANTPDNSLSGKKRKFASMEPVLNSHKKEVFHKEEYEVLEMTPFTDYAEFLRHCPSVLQRTFYRWKRRIKDEYIFLEQHPDMTYQEYIQYIPHAKENVFIFWKSLMQKGYLFGTGSTNHMTSISLKTDLDSRKSSPVPNQQQWDDENNGHKVLKFMQKNITAEYSEVAKHFPNFPKHVFKIWKQQNLQAWKFLEQNFSIDYALFSRCFPTVAEEVFNIWRENVLRENRNKILNLQREAVSTAEHIQEAQKVLWTSMMSQRLAQEQSRFSTNPGTWPGMSGSWLGDYPGFWGTALNLSGLARMDSSQVSQLPMSDTRHSESSKNGSTSDNSSEKNLTSVPNKMSHSDLDETDIGFLSKNHQLKKKNRIFSAHGQESPRSLQSDSVDHATTEKLTVDSDRDDYDDEPRDENLNIDREEKSSRKINEHEFLYLQLHPNIDFAGFTYQFPNTSVRTFYRWRREIQDQINVLRADPNISFVDFHKTYPKVSEKVVSKWREVVLSEKELMNGCEDDSVNLSSQIEKFSKDDNHVQTPLNQIKKVKLSSSDEQCTTQSNNSPTSCDNFTSTFSNSRVSGKALMKASRQEYCFLQRNPDIDLQGFLRLFPDTPTGTFYRWRREIKSIIEFISAHPDASYQDIVSELPEVSQEMFHEWKERLKTSQEGSGNQDQNPIRSLQALVNDGETYATKQGYHREPGFLYLLENPLISIVEFSKLFPAVPAGMFSRWKKLVRDWFSLLKVSTDIDYKTFSFYCREVPETVFTKWKTLIQKKEETTDEQCKADSNNGNSPEDWVLTKTRKVNQTEYLFFLMNPYMDYNEFAITFPLISLRTFYRWRREIRESLEYLEQHPDVSYKAFCQVFTVVPEEVFNRWKELSAEQNRKVEMSSESLKRQLQYHDHENTLNQIEVAASSPDSANEASDGQSLQMYSDPGVPSNKALDIPDHAMFSTDSPDPPGIVSSLSSSESLSAAVESICRSAGLPPLDQSVDEISEQRASSPATTHAGSSGLGGVAFPGMSSAQSSASPTAPDTAPSQYLAIKQEESFNETNSHTKLDSFPSTVPQPSSSNLGGITFPGMSSVPTSIPPSYLDSGALSSQMVKEESFFSPRARKQSREEYLFLQQNPNMDFLEFCSHYPTISLRTFYRWKREFRQSNEYMMGLHGSLQNVSNSPGAVWGGGVA
ncbi:LOW QUALITY PROTEIN: uncharacterized protein LOC124284094 [Haliotis rubra]|uniref:LOW QUALITY PROTEIN: uncharacterized protein LOC124284094 n=1 Tax=Haliotis rubra TaxID=36100 RepID=UPI001EE59490|nr:LOW QUALITY PROTEIN: uncharacterized protein LOC124284094 [Haliotis rubra]